MATEIDSVIKELHDIKAFYTEHFERGIAPLKEEQVRIAKALLDAQTALREYQRSKLAGMSDDGRLRVKAGRLAGYDPFELRLLEGIILGRIRARMSPGDSPVLEAVRAERRNLRDYITPETMLGWEDSAIKRRLTSMWPSPAPRTMEVFRGGLSGWVRAMVEMQTKAMDSTTAGAGDELVPTFEAAELWMDVNLDTLVLPLLPQVAMPTNPFDFPLQLGDTNWYPTSENVQVTTTSPTTAKTTLTAYGLKTGVPFSDELEEDAVIAIVPELRRSLVRNASEVIDDVLLNGDTTAANGINSDGVTITTSSAGKAHWLLGFDGLIHLPLVDNTAQRNTLAGAVTADAYNAILAKLGRYAVPRRRGEVVYITDVNTATRSLSITEFETVDVAGPRATLSTGEILSVYGKPLIQSEQMRLADANDGKVTDSGNSTSTGRILVLNTSQWRVGFRRQITVEVDREPGKSQSTLYVSFRIALTERTGTRSTATHTALQFHVTGVA